MRNPLMPFVLLLTAVIVFFGAPASGQVQQCRVDFPGMGTVTVKAHVSEREPFTCPFLTVTAADGSLLTRVDFFDGGQAARSVPLRFTVVSLPGLEGPWIVATAGSAGGSDSSFETTVVGLSGGHLRDLLPKHVQTQIQGAVCVGRFGPEPRPSLLVLREVWGEGEVHYGAHRYTVGRYDWTGSALEPARVVTTRLQYNDWKECARALGYCCRRNFPELLVPELR